MDKMELLKAQLQQWLHQGEELFHRGKELFHQIPPEQIYYTVAVLLFTFLLIIVVHLFKRTISNTIVLTDLSGSGKTVLFYQLRDGSCHHSTVTSMEPNEGIFDLHSETTKKGKIKPVHLVDVPGHARLRPKLE